MIHLLGVNNMIMIDLRFIKDVGAALLVLMGVMDPVRDEPEPEPEPEPPPKPKRKRKPRPKVVKVEEEKVEEREVVGPNSAASRRKKAGTTTAGRSAVVKNDQPLPTVDEMVEKIKDATAAARNSLATPRIGIQSFSNEFVRVCDTMKDVHERKNSDYSGDSDPLRNFRRAEGYGVSPFLGVIIRNSDKWSRVESLYSKFKQGVGASVPDEGIRDTLIDMANYSLIAIIVQHEEVMGVLGSEKPSKVVGRNGHPMFFDLVEDVKHSFFKEVELQADPTDSTYEVLKSRDLGIDPMDAVLTKLMYDNIMLERLIKSDYEEIAAIKPVLMSICKYSILASCLWEANVSYISARDRLPTA